MGVQGSDIFDPMIFAAEQNQSCISTLLTVHMEKKKQFFRMISDIILKNNNSTRHFLGGRGTERIQRAECY